MISQLPRQAIPVATMPTEIVDATECVVASVLLDRSTLAGVLAIIGGREAIKDHRARLLFDAVVECDRQGLDTDPMTVLAAVRIPEYLTREQFEAYVLNIAAKVPHADHAESYARILAEWNQRQKLKQAAQELLAAADDKSRPVDEIAVSWSERLTQTADATEPRFELMDIADLLATEFGPEKWVAEDCIKEGAVTLIAGPKKTGKTSIAGHLMVSIATGSNFLCVYPVPQRRKVFAFLGETLAREFQTTVARDLASRGLAAADVAGWIHAQTCERAIPSINSSSDLAELSRLARKNPGSVILIDCLYLAAEGADGSDIFDLGPKIRRLANSMPGCTLVLLHHAKKNNNVGEFLDLSSMSGVGPDNVAGGWILVNRHEEYVEGSRLHKLNAVVGGRGGHGAKLFIELNEATGQVDCSQADGAAIDNAKNQARVEKEHAARNVARSKIIKAMRDLGPASKSSIRNQAGQSAKVADEIISDLLNELVAEECEFSKGSRTFPGFRLTEQQL